jgi:ectoine hydroxylase-related dioxygenase (phytanoyl-CoA dioxygenase family)
MTTREALQVLGVRSDTLSPEEERCLDEDGFLPLPGILMPGQVARIADRLEELAETEGERAGIETHQEAGSIRLSDLINKDPLFDVTFTHPRVLAAVSHVLGGAFRLSSLNSRAAQPGEGLQHLHADWDGPVVPAEYQVCNTIWLLDDFTEENGATRLVPGSHRGGKMPRDEMPDPGAPHPREVKLIAPAGTVVVFNSHVWHGGTRNHTSRARRAMHAYFCRRDQPQQTDQRRYLRPETAARLSQAARFILDI